eukprot:366263-Chlamydomonas_euryale.AAC.4
MNPYDKLRGSMSFPINYELGRSMSTLSDSRGKAISQGCKNYVVKLVACKPGPEGGPPVECGFFNGFFYTDEAPLILTCGHIDGWDGATSYHALLYHGTPVEQRLDLQLIKFGRETGPQQTTDGIPFNGHAPDLALLRASSQPAHALRPFAAQVTTGDTVFVIGFKGKNEAQLTFDQGIVVYRGMQEMLLTGYADNGFSGCPVFSFDGFVAGMVVGCDGYTVKHTKAISTEIIHSWLRGGETICPGFLS